METAAVAVVAVVARTQRNAADRTTPEMHLCVHSTGDGNDSGGIARCTLAS